jgi:hypothetical protein
MTHIHKSIVPLPVSHDSVHFKWENISTSLCSLGFKLKAQGTVCAAQTSSSFVKANRKTGKHKQVGPTSLFHFCIIIGPMFSLPMQTKHHANLTFQNLVGHAKVERKVLTSKVCWGPNIAQKTFSLERRGA